MIKFLIQEKNYYISSMQWKDKKDMSINRCVLFLDTTIGSLEAETVQEKTSQGIKVTLRNEGVVEKGRKCSSFFSLVIL